MMIRNKILKLAMAIIISMAIMVQFSSPIYAGTGEDQPTGILDIDEEIGTGFQALTFTVTSVSSHSSIQAFAIGWTIRILNANGTTFTSVYVSTPPVFDGSTRTYYLPLSDGYSRTGTTVSSSIESKIRASNPSLVAGYKDIVEQNVGATFLVDARIQKYTYNPDRSPQFQAVSPAVYANNMSEINKYFSEFSTAFKENLPGVYFDLSRRFKPEPKPFTNTVKVQYWENTENGPVRRSDLKQSDIVVTSYKSTSVTFKPVTIPDGYTFIGNKFQYDSDMPTNWGDYATWNKTIFFPLEKPHVVGYQNILINKDVTPPVIDPNPPDIEGGDIVFNPNQTNGWTNAGRTGDGTGNFGVTVTATKPTDTQTVEWVDPVTKKKSSGTITANIGPISVRYSGSSGGSSMCSSGSKVYITNQGATQLSARAAYFVTVGSGIPSSMIPSPPADATGSSGTYYLDWKTPWSSVSVQPKLEWFPEVLEFTNYFNENLSGFRGTTWSMNDTSWYQRSSNGSISNGVLYDDQSFSLSDGIYTLSNYLSDAAGNTGTATYAPYKVDTTDPDEATFLWDNQVELRDDTYEYMADVNNTLKYRIGDNLSGVKEMRYAVTQSAVHPDVGEMAIVSDGTTPEGQKATKDLTLRFNNINAPYKDWKKGLWYVQIYQIDRAGHARWTTSPKIFFNKIENFRISMIEDPRWAYLFFDRQLNPNSKKKSDRYTLSNDMNNFSFGVKKMPINATDNELYETNIKKGYPLWFNYESYGFNTSDSKMDIYISYWWWDGGEWNRVGTQLPWDKELIYFYSLDRLHFFPLADFPQNNLVDGSVIRDYEHIWTTSDTRRFFNFRSSLNFVNASGADIATENDRWRKAVWTTRFAAPFGAAIFGGETVSPDGNGYLMQRNVDTGVRDFYFTNPILVNFDIVGTKGKRTFDYTVKEDTWFNDPLYPNRKGNIFVFDKKSLEADEKIERD